MNADLLDSGVIPLVTVASARAAAPLWAAMADGGIRVVEVTLRTPAGLDALTDAAKTLVAGAGTVVDPAQVDAAVDAGAAFIVSPGCDPRVVERARERGVPTIPGVATATEVQLAASLGLDRLKLFPAGLLGGLDLIDAFRGPFPGIRYLVSGGVTAENLRDYLRHPGVFAASGSWLAPSAAIAAGDWKHITDRCAAAVEVARAGRPA